MKHSFLKIGLFSLMLALVPVAFTGCKDYDGDINTLTEKDNNLQTQLSALQSALDKCNADVASAKQAAQQSADDALKQAKAYADQAAAQAKADAISAAIAQVEEMMKGVPTNEDLNNLATTVSAIDSNLNKVAGEVDEAQSAIEALQIQMAAVQAYKDLIDANSEEIGKINDAISALKEAIQAIQDSKPATEESLGELKATVEDLAKQIAAIQPGLVTLLNETLRSLVFIPNLYVDGVEAVEYPFMPYDKLPLKSGDANYYNHKNVQCNVPAPTSTNGQVDWYYNWDAPVFVTDYNPIVNVTYELNPSTSIVKEDQLAFTPTRDVEMVSRGVDAVESHNLKVAPNSMKIENGNLTVGFTTRGKDILSKAEKTTSPNADSYEGSIFALQATVAQTEDNQDVVVTSDYAMLYPSTVTVEAIGYPRASNPAAGSYLTCNNASDNKLLFKTMKGAVENVPTFAVQYDNGSLDLTTVVDIHYAIASLTNSNGHHIWNYGEEAHYGLHYDFALVQYTVGPNNHTSDSRYAKIDNNVFYPRTVDAQGNTLDETGIASVGREPIVRVRVLDQDDNVVLVGFIKIRIVKNIEALVTAPFASSVNFEACQYVDAALTWSQISRELLDLTAATSKAEFDALYELDVDANGYAKQFKSATKDAALINNPYIPYGAIKERLDPNAGIGSVTNVITWTLPTGESYTENGNTITCHGQQYIFENCSGREITVYVRYVSRVGDADDTAQPMIYIPWTVKVVKPLTGGNITEKSLAWWFNNNADTYMNVPYPSNDGTPAPFERDQNDNWLNALPVFSAVAGYPASTPANAQPGSYKFYFTGNQMSGVTAGTSIDENIAGANCILGETVKPVNAANMLEHLLWYNSGEFNNDCLWKNGTIIATLDQNTGVITYQKSGAAKEILNKDAAPYRDQTDATSLRANVGLVNSTTCGYAVPMNNFTYDNYFLRPLTVTQAQTGEFVDAQANGSWVRIADLLSFTDWRKVKFVNGTDYSNAWLLAYYDVQAIEVDILNATATSNGQTGNFWAMFPNAQFMVCQDNTLPATSIGPSNTIGFSFKNSYNSADHGTLSDYEAMANKMGYLFFQNTNGVVNETTIKVNVKITYYWGELTVKDVVLVAKQTMGN